MSITDDHRFPFDYDAYVYHIDGLVTLATAVETIEKFLRKDEQRAIEFLLKAAYEYEIDFLASDGEDLPRPATTEGAKGLLIYWLHQMQSYDGASYSDLSKKKYFFVIEQVEKMMNMAVKGNKSPFSIPQPLEQEKPSAVSASPNAAAIQNNINANFDPQSPTYPPELDAALRAWREVSQKPLSNRGIATQMSDWIEKNMPGFSSAALTRMSLVANWDKQEEREKKNIGKPRKVK